MLALDISIKIKVKKIIFAHFLLLALTFLSEAGTERVKNVLL
jgi:hypothetical protein